MQKTEIRTVSTALRSASSFKLEGTAVTYGALSREMPSRNGSFVERIAPGAFIRSLADKSSDVFCLFNHDANKVLGRQKNGTLVLRDSNKSLDFTCQLDENNTEHQNLYSSVKRGDISSCSFAFNIDGTDGEEYDWSATDSNGQGIRLRTVRNAKLYDVSAVTHPAYPGDATNVNARQFRSCDYVVAAQPTELRRILTPTLTAVDVENRRRLQRIEQMIYSDKSFQGRIEDMLLQKRAKHIAEVIERDDRKEILETLRAELGE